MSFFGFLRFYYEILDSEDFGDSDPVSGLLEFGPGFRSGAFFEPRGLEVLLMPFLGGFGQVFEIDDHGFRVF